ncbi:hypothetical protein Pelo_4226 [Pelomyxa schiedti]|nr:hypothetical protein Pelo_4226 [Pelomyxa schiedti]
MDVDRHLIRNTGSYWHDLCVVDSTTYTPAGYPRGCFRVHPDWEGVFDCSPRWVVVFPRVHGGDGTNDVMIVTKAVDLAALEFSQCHVNMPYRCYAKSVSFCIQSDRDQAVVILTKPNEMFLFFLVVDVAKSFASRNLVVVFETRYAMTENVRYVAARAIMSLRQITGARCFLYRKDAGLYMLRDGDGPTSEFAISAHGNLSQLSESQFCASHFTCVEIWDCGNYFRDSGAPWKVKVMQFSELGGSVAYVGTAVANSGFLFVKLHNSIKVIEASTGDSWIAIALPQPYHILGLDSVTRL